MTSADANVRVDKSSSLYVCIGELKLETLARLRPRVLVFCMQKVYMDSDTFIYYLFIIFAALLNRKIVLFKKKKILSRVKKQEIMNITSHCEIGRK